MGRSPAQPAAATITPANTGGVQQAIRELQHEQGLGAAPAPNAMASGGFAPNYAPNPKTASQHATSQQILADLGAQLGKIAAQDNSRPAVSASREHLAGRRARCRNVWPSLG
jgi:hypothetical protein